MASYILSDANRFYVATEKTYGIPALVDYSNRLAAFSFDCHQRVELGKRRDKTGARTYTGNAPHGTRRSSFDLSAHFVAWDTSTQPNCGPLIQAAMGATPEFVQGLKIAAVTNLQIQTQSPHGLGISAAVSNGEEIRFVVEVPDSLTFSLNAPFSANPGAGSVLATTVAYQLATQLPSVSIYDYWDPTTGVSRIVTGGGVDKFRVEVKSDMHELMFSGPAADVLDSSSGSVGNSGIVSFPAEPTASSFNSTIVDGQLGQVWLGSPLNRVFALTEASIEINNNLLVRNQEFGSLYPTALVPGPREVISRFTLFAQPDSTTQSLYSAAKLKTPISALVQLGQQRGQMMAIYLPNVIAELPLFNDSEPYLLWEFKNNLAQGVSNDEISIAFA